MRNGILSDITWKELAEIQDKVKMAVIPVGSTEQHGPHLPLKNDTASVFYIAEKLAQKFYPKLLITPAIPYGISYHHMHFPGTISVSPDTLISLLVDICESLVAHGIDKILILNGHGGNFETISTAVVTIKQRFKINIYFANYWDFLPKSSYHLVEDGKIPGHSAEFETSIALHIYPEMVRTKFVQASDQTDKKLLDFEKFLVDKSRMYTLELEKSISGVPDGNPTLATGRKGEDITKTIINKLASLIKDIT